MSEPNPDLEIVKRHCQQLGEHFDSVQIFVTRHMPAELSGTRNINYGSGNWFTRYGQVQMWLKYSEAYEQARSAADHKEDTQ